MGNDFGGGERTCANRHNLIVFAVDNQGWHIKLFEILGEIGLGEGFDTIERILVTTQHALVPERVDGPLRSFGTSRL